MPPPGVCLDIIKERVRAEGMGTMENPVRFRGQDFNTLRENCLRKKERFYDYEFPPDSSSIGGGLLEPDIMKRVEWIRPKKIERIAGEPQLFLNGVSRFDFAQGQLGNCWFLAAVGALTFHEHLLKQVLPTDQGFRNDYAGIFHFRFWRFGKWVDVVIDDKLPTVNGDLIFVHPRAGAEFWPALLEKAYAKVCGSYADMKAGTVSEALLDFTGGVHVTLRLKEMTPHFWDLMHSAVKYRSLIGCATPQGKTPANEVLPNGLVEGHAYAVTGVKQVRFMDGQTERLVRVWNPWCDQTEWTGDWSDKSQLWSMVIKEDMCRKIENDGEFWMSMKDFQNNFTDVDICCNYPEFLDGLPSRWVSSCHEGRWVEGTTAGGSMTHQDTFWRNPQYQVKIKNGEHQGGNNVVVALLQKSDKKFRHLVSNWYIGFFVFQVPPEFQDMRGKFPASFFTNQKPIAQPKGFWNAREVSEFFHLPPGQYIIVPCTYEPNEPASFILRLFSKLETSTIETSIGDSVTLGTVHYSTGQLLENQHEMFNQYSNQYKEVDAEQLQRLLNNNIAHGAFGLDTCRSIVAMMDLSVTGTLNVNEFQRLWKRVVTYRDFFFKTDVSHSGSIPLRQLRDVIQSLGHRVSDDVLNVMALRHGSLSGGISLETFIFLMLRVDWMSKIFRNLSDGKRMNLQKNEWFHIALYS